MNDFADKPTNPAPDEGAWDNSSHAEFYDYYAQESLTEETLIRFRRPRDLILTILGNPDRALDVADIGCGAGTSARIWAELDHRVRGLDVNGPLVELARKRAAEAKLPIEFTVGSATDIPWPSESLDICVAPELLEHVADWEACLNEFARILRPGGALFLSTTSKLCPIQCEFNLPLYSWYPGPLKRHYEKLAVTTRPEIANYAKYPAVNWFTFYSLRKSLRQRGFDRFFDRFDMASLHIKDPFKSAILALVRSNPPMRFAGHVGTLGSILVALKKK